MVRNSDEVDVSFAPTGILARSLGPLISELNSPRVNVLASTAVTLAINNVVAMARITVITLPVRV